MKNLLLIIFVLIISAIGMRHSYQLGILDGEEAVNQCLARNWAYKPVIPWKGIGKCFTDTGEE